MARQKKAAEKSGSNTGLQMIGGAAAGAAAGSLVGPVGAAVGAVVGSIAGASAEMIVASPAVKKRFSVAKKAVGKALKKTSSRGSSSKSTPTKAMNGKRIAKAKASKKSRSR